MSGCSIDFLPVEWREQRSRRRLWAFRAALAVLLALVLGVGTLAVDRRRTALAATLQQVRVRREQVQSRITQVEQLDRKKEELERRVGVLAHVLARARGSLVLAAVGSSCPDETTLTKVDVRARVRSDPPQVDVTIEGRCPDDLGVADLLSRLSSHPLFDDVRMVLSEDIDARSSGKKFVLAASAPLHLDEERLARALEATQ